MSKIFILLIVCLVVVGGIGFVGYDKGNEYNYGKIPTLKEETNRILEASIIFGTEEEQRIEAEQIARHNIEQYKKGTFKPTTKAEQEFLINEKNKILSGDNK